MNKEPKLKSAEEWVFEYPGSLYNAQSIVEQIQQNAIAFARYQALTEAAILIDFNLPATSNFKMILELRDTTKEGK